MKCNDAINRYLALDKHESVPFKLTLHLLRCKKCRSLVRAMTKASAMCVSSFSSTVTKDDKLMLKVMKTINETGDITSVNSDLFLPEVKMLPWVFIGVIMAVGFASIPFTVIGRWASQVFKHWFTVPFTIIFVAFVSIYTAIFVGSNLDFFVKKIESFNAQHIGGKN